MTTKTFEHQINDKVLILFGVRKVATIEDKVLYNPKNTKIKPYFIYLVNYNTTNTNNKPISKWFSGEDLKPIPQPPVVSGWYWIKIEDNSSYIPGYYNKLNREWEADNDVFDDSAIYAIGQAIPDPPK